MGACREITGFLLDAYPDPTSGDIAVWLLADSGERLRLTQPFPITFCAAGPAARLRALWQHLSGQPGVRLARAARRDLFSPAPLTVLAATVARAARQPRLFRQAARAFPDLDFYDADVPLLARFAARWNVYPLARCRVTVDAAEQIQTIAPIETRWAVDATPAPLRVLTLAPDCDPFHVAPTRLSIQAGKQTWTLPLAQPPRSLLVVLASILRKTDPDLILTDWGDTWLLPRLLELAENLPGVLRLNRDPALEPQRKEARTYQAYGQVIYRGEQVHLFGRWHIDRMNAMMYHDYGLEGIFELARVSGQPVQVAARHSPGAGITAMQMITAMRENVLVPYRRQQAEHFHSAADLIAADRGGLVASPLVGLYEHVAEIDFISMYPSIIRKFNISPETMDANGEASLLVPGIGRTVAQGKPGLLPATIAPLLDKRIAIKEQLAALDPRDCRAAGYKARAAAIKWLLVVSFGYAGYRNARFGRIEAHQAITAYAREVLLRAKEVAEDQGFEVLHMYVDCLWVRKPGHQEVADFQPLLEAIAADTGLPIALDGVFRWVAFLPSRLSPRLGVANRYFGVFQSGEIKMRGIETRRHDSPPLVTSAQRELLDLMAGTGYAKDLPGILPAAAALLKGRLRQLAAGRIPAEQLVLRQRLTRQPGEYRSPSPSARAAMQLAAEGKSVATGQYVTFVFTRGRAGVTAWDGSAPFDLRTVDCERYARLLLRAAETVLQPVGVSLKELVGWMHGAPVGVSAPGLPVGLLSGRSLSPEDHQAREEEYIGRSEAYALVN